MKLKKSMSRLAIFYESIVVLDLQYNRRFSLLCMTGVSLKHSPIVFAFFWLFSLFSLSLIISSKTLDCGECTSARSQSDRCIQSKSTWLNFGQSSETSETSEISDIFRMDFGNNTPSVLNAAI